jgi:hypothetical protein
LALTDQQQKQGSNNRAQLNSLLAGYLAVAKSELTDEAFANIQPELLANYISLVHEAVPIESLLDKSLVKQAIHSLAANNSVEETLMFSFMLHIYKLYSEGSGHPLETGIIRQQINGILPVFENAKNKSLIRAELFSSNAQLLGSIADRTAELPAALETLAAGYRKYADN